MASDAKYGPVDVKTRLSTLWTVVMFNMVFADILSFITPGVLQEMMTGFAGDVRLTQGILLVFALLLEIPIAMIFLSRYLGRSANRWANIAASVITIAFVVGGGAPYAHYIFFASVEVGCMLCIIWFAWKWPNEAPQPMSATDRTGRGSCQP